MQSILGSHGERTLQRLAFQLRIREGKAEEYDEAHRHVWPALQRELEEFGVREYSIFRRGLQLFLYLHVPDPKVLFQLLEKSDVNRQWQLAMAPLFEPVEDLLPEEPFAIMREVFYMPGTAQLGGTSSVQGGQHEREI
jgi:L-rhamnose mutarotase